MRGILERILAGGDLAVDQAGAAFDRLMAGELTAAQTGALLFGLRLKGESVSEIAAAAAAMRRRAVLIDAGGLPVIDTCGTGGDRLGTFNVSTAAALVAAGAGVPIAKHGNRAMTSRCGSADVLAVLGVDIEAAPELVEECLREAGMGFLYAQRLHPAMKNVAGVRRELGVRTIFNLLGPLTNPAGARAQLLGVFASELTEPLAQVLRELGSRRAMVVHGNDGMDEITTTASTRITELRDGRLRTYEFDPLPFIGEYANLSDLAGGAPAENAGILEGVLNGAAGAPRDIVVLNAAAAILVGGRADEWPDAVRLAQAALDEGRARAVLSKMASITRPAGSNAAPEVGL